MLKLVKGLIPVWLRTRIKERRICFSGIYENVSAMKRRLPNATYHNSTSIAFDRQRMLATRNELYNLVRIDYRPNLHPRYAYLATIVASLLRKDVCVLDIGGAAGYGYPYVKWACPGKNIRFVVADLPEICALGHEVLGDVDGLCYSDVPRSERYDLVFFGASVQYFEDPIFLLESWAAFGSSIIAFAESPLSENSTFVTAQVDQGRKRAIPSVIHSRQELCEAMRLKGYELMLRVSHSEHKGKFLNFPLPYSASGYWTLVFRRLS